MGWPRQGAGGAPGAGPCPRLPGLGRPVRQERQHFWERYHACFPPAASLDWLVCQPFPAGAPRRAVPRCAVPRQPALIWWQPPMPVPGAGMGRAGNRKVQRAGNGDKQGTGTGREPGQAGSPPRGEGAAWWGGGGCDPPLSPRKGTSQGHGGPHGLSISPVGIRPRFGTPQGPLGGGGLGGPGCICKLLTAQPAAAWRQAGSRGLERARRSQLGIYYPASGCRAKVTVTNGLLHACHISSAHRGRLPALPAPVCGSLCPPSLPQGGDGGKPPLSPFGDLIQSGWR